MKKMILIFIPVIMFILTSGCTSKVTTPYAGDGDLDLVITLPSYSYNISTSGEFKLKVELVNIAGKDVKVTDYYSSLIDVRLILDNSEYVMLVPAPHVNDGVDTIVVKSGKSLNCQIDLINSEFNPLDNTLETITFPVAGNIEIFCLSQWSESNHVICQISE